MTKKEFLERMERVLSDVRGGRSSCIALYGILSPEASSIYNKELRYRNSLWWINDFVYLQDRLPKSDFEESRILARELHLGLFQQFVLDNELYKEW